MHTHTHTHTHTLDHEMLSQGKYLTIGYVYRHILTCLQVVCIHCMLVVAQKLARIYIIPQLHFNIIWALVNEQASM